MNAEEMIDIVMNARVTKGPRFARFVIDTARLARLSSLVEMLFLVEVAAGRGESVPVDAAKEMSEKVQQIITSTLDGYADACGMNAEDVLESTRLAGLLLTGKVLKSE